MSHADPSACSSGDSVLAPLLSQLKLSITSSFKRSPLSPLLDFVKGWFAHITIPESVKRTSEQINANFGALYDELDGVKYILESIITEQMPSSGLDTNLSFINLCREQKIRDEQESRSTVGDITLQEVGPRVSPVDACDQNNAPVEDDEDEVELKYSASECFVLVKLSLGEVSTWFEKAVDTFVQSCANPFPDNENSGSWFVPGVFDLDSKYLQVVKDRSAGCIRLRCNLHEIYIDLYQTISQIILYCLIVYLKVCVVLKSLISIILI